MENFTIEVFAKIVAASTVAGAIIERFGTLIFIPAVEKVARSFDESKNAKIQQAFDSAEQQRKDVSNLYRDAYHNLTMIRKFLHQVNEYGDLMKELKNLAERNSNDHLMNRCKQNLCKYERLPEVIATHLEVYQRYVKEIESKMESCTDSWETLEHNKQLSDELTNLESYIIDGQIVEYLEHAVDQFRTKAEFAKDLLIRYNANVWTHFKDVKL